MRQACIVPGCASNARTPAHIFPKNVNQRLLWLKKLKIENIEHVISLARCKLRVCYKYFSDDDYIYSAKCIAASNNIDSQQALISDCNLEFCPDIIALEPLQSAHENQDIRYATYIQEHDMNSNRSNEVMNSSIEVMNSNEVIEETLLSNAIMEHVQHTEGETRDKVTNFAYKRHERQDEVLATPNRRQQETNVRLFKRRTLLLDCRRQADLTPKAAKLYKIARNLFKRKRCIEAQNSSMRRILRTSKRLQSTNFIEQYEGLSKTQRILIQMQLRTAQQPSHVRRYTVDEKILAISLLQRSPKCYSLIQNLYNMPSSKTLKRLLQKVVLKPGLCKIIIRYLHEKAKKMHNKDKYCILMWDEIALTPHIQYDSKNDLITGFEDWGMRRTNKFADHVLVFMLRGLYSGWKMPISFGYCDSQTKTPQLLRCIKQIITAVNKTELEIVATVCDQGSSNVAAINTLLKDTARKLWKQGTEHRRAFEVDGKEIIPFFDPPHLIKGVRNNLLNKDLEINISRTSKSRQFASWKTIELAYKIDTNVNNFNRMLSKITEEHVVPDKIKKMRVKNATQIFSSTFSAYIGLFSHMQGHVDTRIGPLSIPKEEAVTMSKTLQFFNDLFDSVNGYTTKPEAPLRSVVKENSVHHEFWKDAIRRLKAMRYVHPVSKKPLTGSLCIQNWIKSIDAFQDLWTVLQEKDFKQFKPRYVNQDPLENFFGCIRSTGGRDINPTCTNFCGAYKVLLINNLSSRHSIGQNCENICDGHLLFSLKDFISEAHEDDAKFDEVEEDECAHIVESSSEEINENRCNLQDRSVYNILKNNLLIKASFKHCAACRATITDSAILQQILKRAETLVKKYITRFCFKSKIKSIIEREMEKQFDFTFIKCQQHDAQLKNAILSTIITTCLKKFCTAVNRCFNSKYTSTTKNPVLIFAQIKYRSRIKKKREPKSVQQNGDAVQK
ncbi:uncharacterized protein LOC112456393 isoform X2 [Temnothorax curvispinosus]|uniref:Uncharacterized protein LOC112456393 isoform X2 n=1 Tax=Temnothorax curvispinosus TaxID=300111 RepID=A0A6J1PYP7_9HYME|nr:uncharacterized protein LOC112456393 isoform X2 [Temnothorax curvispinosus]